MELSRQNNFDLKRSIAHFSNHNAELSIQDLSSGSRNHVTLAGKAAEASSHSQRCNLVETESSLGGPIGHGANRQLVI